MFEKLNDIFNQAKERLEEAKQKAEHSRQLVIEFSSLISNIVRELDMPSQQIKIGGEAFTISENGIAPAPKYSQLESLELEMVRAINSYINKIEECE